MKIKRIFLLIAVALFAINSFSTIAHADTKSDLKDKTVLIHSFSEKNKTIKFQIAYSDKMIETKNVSDDYLQLARDNKDASQSEYKLVLNDDNTIKSLKLVHKSETDDDEANDQQQMYYSLFFFMIIMIIMTSSN